MANYDPVFDEDACRAELYRTSIRLAQVNERVETILENLENMDSRGNFHLPEREEKTK